MTTMRSTLEQATKIVAELTTEQKITLVSGADLWHTEEMPGVPAIMLTDGPHGLRKQTESADPRDISGSEPATCFPTAAALGSSWDKELAEEVGRALGREALAENVAVILGPGLNIKRHSANGRTFEYFSEDPVVSGEMAGALVRGIQSQGIAACLKHYAANNQEHRRMSIDAIVDERTLREIYLTGFEIAVKNSDPWTVMSSYNKVNGDHVGESRELMTEILRDEWGFDGLAMTDWLATYDRPQAVAAGLDLEMPGSDGTWDKVLANALKQGTLTEQALDLAAARVVDLVLRTRHDGDAAPRDTEAHHALARKAAAAGTVLLTNDGILPLKPSGTIAVIGAFATKPRFQGAGSSLVNPTQVDTFLESLRELVGADAEVTYAAGYDPATGRSTPALMKEATDTAQSADAVVLMIGLPSVDESEGYDRPHLRLPDSHDSLVAAVTAVNDRTVVALSNGAPVLMPWADQPAAIVESYLGGQASGAALADVLLGRSEPGGRLAESFPVNASDVPADSNFPGGETQVEYREGLYVGYRFHDSAGVAARFPFGHGLSYTSFEYSDLSVRKTRDTYKVSVNVTNTGTRAGSEVVQVYVRDVESTVYRPTKELKAFEKVHLEPGESQLVSMVLDRRAFAVWDVASHDWKVEAGEFEILVGASSVDIRLTKTIKLASDDVVAPAAGPSAFVASDSEFAAMLGHPIPTPRPTLPFNMDSTMGQLDQTWLGAKFAAAATRVARRSMSGEGETAEAQQGMFDAMLRELPLRGIAMGSQGKFPLSRVKQLIAALNSTSFKAIKARR
jgi:beta-glucosidase